MENQRLFIIIALVFLGMVLYQEWQRDYGPKPATTTTSTQAPASSSTPAVPTASSVPAAPAPSANSDVPTAVQPAAPASPVVSGEGNKLPSDRQVRIRTDVLDVVLDTRGGDIRQVELVKFPVELDKPEEAYRLMTDKGARFFVAQSGFVMQKGKGPTHEANFQAEKTDYVLAEGQDSVTVNLTWTDASGVQVIKRYTFRRGDYLVDINTQVVNNSGADWQGSLYHQQQRTQYGEQAQSMFVMQTYMGGVVYTPEDLYEKISFSDMQDGNLSKQNVRGGWISMMQHYFLAAWVPPAEAVNNFYTSVRNYRYYIGMVAPAETVPAGQNKTFNSRFYVGPKNQKVLENIAEGLELTVDYGFLTVISKPLFWLLDMLNKLFNNWGWSIIFLTIIIKLAFYKLSEASYKSMANMRKLQPRMQALKERHGDDKQRMNQALMELYKKEKINPLGGCLPILVQIPVFIALYWVLLEAVELRQAPFMLWIQDLSAQDPYYVLPILMGATMFLQQKLNPAPLDPIQAKIMMALPLVFTVFFLFFPSGLVLYWVVNNTLSIAQQWVITKRIEAQK